MPNIKSIMLDHSQSGVVLYCSIRREVDGFLMDNLDGAFTLSPSSLFIPLVESSILKGRYELFESRTAWDNGEYSVAIYEQQGSSPSISSDPLVGSGKMYIVSDLEVLLDAPVSSRAPESGGNIATIMGKTNNLPPDPADASDIATAFGAVPGAVWANATRTLTTIIGVNKNAALNAFEFLMVDSSGDPKTGLTVTAERSIDGGAFAACANAVAEVGSGVYKINLAATDLNGNVITIKFTATGAKQTTITIKTAG